MANQTRNETDSRLPNGNAPRPGNGPSGATYASAPTGTQDASARDAGQGDDFYRRAETSAGSRGGYAPEQPPWGRSAAAPRGAEGWGRDDGYGRGPGYGRAPASPQDRGQDARRGRSEEYGPRGWADSHAGQQHPFDRARMGTTDDMEDVGAGSSLGYGDYGHPGDGGRRAYGDMGFGHGGVGPGPRGARPVHHEPEHPHHGAHTQHPQHEGMFARMRRKWRGAAQSVRDVMTKNPRTVRPTDTAQAVAQVMNDEDTGIVPVCDESGRLLGVVTDRDLALRLVARGLDVRTAKASDVMTDDVECVTEQESLHDVLRMMADHQVRRVPVVARGDRLVGIVSIGDIAREADVDAELQDTFEEISSARTFWSRQR